MVLEEQGAPIGLDEPGPRPRWRGERCHECWACVAACPEGLRGFDEAGAVFDAGRCTGCGACARACPSGALELVPPAAAGLGPRPR